MVRRTGERTDRQDAICRPNAIMRLPVGYIEVP